MTIKKATEAPVTNKLLPKLGHTFALMAAQALIEIDPPKRTPEGRLLLALAKAIESYEREIYPMFAPKKKTAKK